MCGGTGASVNSPLPTKGLSPRVRGNHGTEREDHVRTRSIPACAGEPLIHRVTVSPYTVYPRVCGGTIMEDYEQGLVKGLSPRVRGNLCPF